MRNPKRALACLAALTMVLAAGPPAAASPPAASPPAASPPGTGPLAASQPGAKLSTADKKVAARHASITLITGDRVSLIGGQPRQLDPAKRVRPVHFAQYTVRGDWYVVPSDAQPLISAGVLDKQLFNVTGLLRQGYDDAHSAVVPLLAEYPDARTAVAPSGARKGRVLPSLGLTVLNEQKSAAPRFWSELTRNGPATRTFSGGVRKLWLNGKVKANLDQSVPQVGAPAAWQAGYTGKGVTVAVLDTGYDTDHADLAGRIGATKNFTPTASVEDKFGHGTHVASIALGSGAAASGKYKGVAPDASLAVGKVLDDNGSGAFDWILAGMEWAATDAKAKIVNMSLGGWPSDGTDPLSTAVNRISKQYGTLFVIAAGNFGEDGSISTPAAADAALSIGSVTKSDELSDFSSRGPRLGDKALKPDLAAPGSDIVAARATGTFPDHAVDENYSRLSGTSMSTPHVAGAAAILVQQHPDWSGEQLKAALMNSAKPLGSLPPTSVGAGRLDLARATAQQVQATPGSASTFLKWPHSTTPAQQHTITYHNATATPLALGLALPLADDAGQPSPAGLATLSASTITVPARGQASVTVTVKAVAGKFGIHSGVLAATSTDGKTTVRTPIGVYLEPEQYDLTATVKDRTGANSPAEYNQVAATNLDSGELFEGSSAVKLRVPPGRYAISANVETLRPGQESTFTFLANPNFKVTRDATISLDARTGKRVSMTIDQPAAKGGERVVAHTVRAPGMPEPYIFPTFLDARFHEIYAASPPGVRSAEYAFTNALHGVEPEIELAATAPQKFAVRAFWLGLPTPSLDTSPGVVYGGTGTPAELAKVDAKGKLVVVALPEELTWEDVVARVQNVKAAGGRIGFTVPAEPTGQLASELRTRARRGTATNLGQADELAVPTLYGDSATARRFLEQAKKAGASARLITKQTSRYRYEVAALSRGSIPATPNYDRKTKDLAAVKTRYYGHPGAQGARMTYSDVRLDGQAISSYSWDVTPTATERIEYFTPGQWFQASQGLDHHTDYLSGHLVQFKAGKPNTLEWNKAAYTPSFGSVYGGEENPWVIRYGDLIDVMVPFFGDAAGHLRVPDFDLEVDTGTTSLYRDGKLVATRNTPGQGIFSVPSSPGRYKLSTTARRTQPWWPLATSTAVTWTFRSAGSSSEMTVLPLLTVGFQPALDLRNTAKGGQVFSFPATVARQLGSGTAAVNMLRVSVSYDDGKTWTPTTVARDGAKWKVTVKHPASGYVSLRAFTYDVQGNTVEQTVIRAYQLR